MLDQLRATSKPTRPITPGCKTLPEMFMRRIDRKPHATDWKRKIDGQWVSSTWKDFYEASASLSTWLMDAGLAMGDKLTIVGSTRPEWCICDAGGLLAGSITVGAYATLTAEQLAYIIDHSDSRFAFVEDQEQLEKVIEQKANLPKLERVLVWDTRGIEDLLKRHDWVLPFSEALDKKADRKRIDERTEKVDPLATAVIVY